MALREQAKSRSVRGRHRARRSASALELPTQRTSHRWTSAEAEERAARRARTAQRWATWVPAPRRSPEQPQVHPLELPRPRRSPESGPGALGGARAEAARLTAAGLAGARLATAVLSRATGEQRPLPGVEEAPADPWARRGMPVRYRPIRHRRRRMTVVWILLAVLLVAAVGAIPSALRDPTIRTTSDASAVPVLEDIAGSGGGGPLAPAPAEFTDQLPDSRAQTAIDAALSQVGVPYQWGGDGPAAGDQGFDCSGLTVFAYAAAGISLPRTAHTQYAAGPHVPGDAALQPGDLVFYGTPSAVHHVGVYVGDGRMVNAPTYGLPVQVSYYRWRGDDFLGATRPAATGERRTGLLEFLPQPLRPFAGPRTFDAPRAPALTERVQPSTTLPPQDVTAAAALAATEGTTLPARSAAVPSTGWRPAPAAWVLPMGEHEAGESAADRVTAGSAVGSVAPGTGDGIAAPAGDEPAVRSADRAEPGAGPGAGLAGEPVPGPVDSSAGAGSAAPGQTAVRTDATVGTLTLPAGPLPLYAARLDDQGVPVPPAPGTAALLDEGGAQLVLLAAADLVPLDATLTVAVDGEDPRDRTVVEAETVTAAELAEQVRSLPEGEFQVAAPAADGSWTVAELE